MAKAVRKTEYTEEQMKKIKSAYKSHMLDGYTHDCFRWEQDGVKCSYRNLDEMFKKNPELQEEFFDYKIDQYMVHQKWGKAQILGQVNGSSPTYKFMMHNVHGWRLSDKKEEEKEVTPHEVVVSNALPFEERG